MGLLAILGLGEAPGNAITFPVDMIGTVFDKLFTSEEEMTQAKAVLEKLRQQPQVLQVEINKLEAQHRSKFVAGWRPFIGWVCGFGMSIHFILNPLFAWYCSIFVTSDFTPPVLPGVGELMNLLLAMLGMAGIRSFDKVKKLSK